MIFGKIGGEPWYGKNSGVLQRFAAGPDDVELAGSALSGGTRGESARDRGGTCAECSTNHSVRAAARTKRKVLAPTTRSRLRHWSCPKPAKALLSRMVISTAHRSRYWARIASRLNVRSVVKNASTGGSGLRRLGLRGRSGVGRRTTTTRIKRPGKHGMPQPRPRLDERPGFGGMRLPATPFAGQRFRRPQQRAFLRGTPAARVRAAGAAAHRACR